MRGRSDALRILQSVKRDCGELEKKGDLTEYGYGQLALADMFLKR